MSSGIGICILAGGLSTRMGRDKARLRLSGSTLLSIIRRTAHLLPYQVRTIRRDRIKRCGPLGGIYTGLVTSRADAELFLACDMPFVNAALLKRLLAKNRQTGRPVFSRYGKKIGFPLLLPRDCISVVKEQIEGESVSVQYLGRALKAAFVEVHSSKSHPLMNVNTPDDWKEARRLWMAQSKGS